MRAACPIATFARQGLHCNGANPAAWRSWLIKPHWPVPPATRGAPAVAGSGRGCELGARRARHQFGRRRSRLRGQHAVEDASGVAPVFGPVGSVDLIVDGVVGIHERDVLLDATGPDPTFVPLLRAPKPCRRGALNGSDVEAVAIA